MRILIVDDESPMRMLLEEYTRAHGHEVASFPSAEEALQRIAEVDPQVIISDLLMLGMDGWELRHTLSTAKVFAPWRKVPIIFISGTFVGDEDEVEARRLGAFALLPKGGGLRQRLQGELARVASGEKAPDSLPLTSKQFELMRAQRMQVALFTMHALHDQLLTQQNLARRSGNFASALAVLFLGLAIILCILIASAIPVRAVESPVQVSQRLTAAALDIKRNSANIADMRRQLPRLQADVHQMQQDVATVMWVMRWVLGILALIATGIGIVLSSFVKELLGEMGKGMARKMTGKKEDS